MADDDFDPQEFIEDHGPQASSGNDNAREFDPQGFIKEFSPQDFIKEYGEGPEPEGALMSGVRRFAHNVIPGVVGTLGAGVGAGLATPAGPVAQVAAGFGGFVAGSAAAEKAQHDLLHAVAPQWADQDEAQMQANEKAHHYASLAGEIGGQMIGMSPGSVVKGAGNALVDKFGRPVAEAITRGGAGAVQSAVGAIGNYIQGEDQDAGDLALQFAAGAFAPGFNRAGTAINKAGERVGENIAARVGKVAGRPGEARNPGAEQAHEDVGDGTTQTQAEDTNTEGAAFPETPPDADGATVGARDDNKPTDSAGNTATGKPDATRTKKGAPADNSQVTTGDIDPAQKAALDQANEQNAPSKTADPNNPGIRANLDDNAGVPRKKGRNKRMAPPEDDNGGFPKPGDAVATQEDVRPSKPVAAFTPKQEPNIGDTLKALQAENAKLRAEKGLPPTEPVTATVSGPRQEAEAARKTRETLEQRGVVTPERPASPGASNIFENAKKNKARKGEAAKSKSKNANKKSAPEQQTTLPVQPAQPAQPAKAEAAVAKSKKSNVLNMQHEGEVLKRKRALQKGVSPENAPRVDDEPGTGWRDAKYDKGSTLPLKSIRPEMEKSGLVEPKEEKPATYDGGSHPSKEELVGEEKPKKSGPKANPEDENLAEELARLRAEQEQLKKAKAEREAETAAPAKPVKERAAVKDAIKKFEAAGEHEKAEALRNAPDSALEAVKGKRVRKNKGGVPIGDLKNEKGEPVTANTVATAAKNAEKHEAVKKWFEKGHREQAELDKETPAQTLARAAHHGFPEKGWVPAHKPREWLLAREARNLLSSRKVVDPTLGRALTKQEKLQKFREDERILRHGPEEAVDEFRAAKQAEDRLKYAKGRGSDAVDKAEAKVAMEQRGNTEETYHDRLEREEKEWLGQNYKEGTEVRPDPYDALRNRDKEWLAKNYPEGDFEHTKVDPEAIAEGVVEKAIKNKADNAERPKKTKDVTKEGEDEALKSSKKAREAEERAAALEEARFRAKMNVTPEERAKYEAAQAADDKRNAIGRANELARLAKEFGTDEKASLNINQIGHDVKALMKRFLNSKWSGSKVGANISHRDSSYSRSLTADELNNHGKWLRDLQKMFHTNEQTNKAANTALFQASDAMWHDSKEPDAKSKTAQQRRIFEARDADSAHVDLPGKQKGKTNLESLSAEDQRLYNEHLKEVFDENKLYKEGGDIFAPNNAARDVDDHISHLSDGETSEYNLLKNKDDPTSPEYNGLTVSASMSNNRNYFALEDRSGHRHIIQERDNGYNIWRNGKSQKIRDPKFEFEANKPYVYTDPKTGAKQTFTMREAMASEKEKHARGLGNTPAMLKYQHNAALSAFLTNSLMGQRFRNLKLLNKIINSPEFGKMSTTDGKLANDRGWKQTDFPNLKGADGKPIFMDPKMKEVFDSYAKSGFDTYDWWRNLNHNVTRLLFWMPTAHIANVGTHWFVGRGWDNITPAGLHSLIVDGAKAIKSVWNQDDLQKRLMRSGAGLIYPGVNTRNFAQGLASRVGTEMANGPKGVGWRRVADIIGVDPKALGEKFYDWSSRMMWHANDVFLTQRILELERKGMSTEQAIIHAERDIPNYQVPNRIMSSGEAGRFLSKVMSGNDLFTFGRYHYGMWNAYANMIKDAFHPKSSAADRIDAAGKMLAMGFLTFAIYPMMDKLAQFITGNEDASQTRRGPVSIPSHLYRASQGKEDPMSALRSTFTVTPLISTLIEAISGRDYRGKNIIEPGDVSDAFGENSGRQGRIRAGLKVGMQEAEHWVRGTVSPYGTLSNSYKKNPEDAGGPVGVGKAALKGIRDQAADVKNPSDAGANWERKSQKLNARDSRLREKHGGYGIGEDILNRATEGW
jgi:hypothetical protein